MCVVIYDNKRYICVLEIGYSDLYELLDYIFQIEFIFFIK